MDTRHIEAMLSAWNTRNDEAMQQVVSGALAPEVEFCDPHYDIRGHAPFIEMVRAFWIKNGDCTISRASRIDTHHNRARYAWAITWPDGRRFEGFDAVTVDPSSGKVTRVDGFFGPLSPV